MRRPLPSLVVAEGWRATAHSSSLCADCDNLRDRTALAGLCLVLLAAPEAVSTRLAPSPRQDGLDSDQGLRGQADWLGGKTWSVLLARETLGRTTSRSWKGHLRLSSLSQEPSLAVGAVKAVATQQRVE